MKIKKDYYVYAYLDTRYTGNYVYGAYMFDYKPFYIGKGKKNRCYTHLKQTIETTYNKHKVSVINKIRKETGNDPLIIKVIENVSEKKAYGFEKTLIALIGLENLTNKTCGGSDAYTLENHPCKNEIYKKISNSNKKKKAWNKGLTKETDEKTRQSSEKRKNQILSSESRLAMSLGRIGKFTGENSPNFINLQIYEKDIIKWRLSFLSVYKIIDLLYIKYDITISRTPIERVFKKYGVQDKQFFKLTKDDISFISEKLLEIIK